MGLMTQDPTPQPDDPGALLDVLEGELDQADAADAPDTAEEIAGRLGDALDQIDGGSGSESP